MADSLRIIIALQLFSSSQNLSRSSRRSWNQTRRWNLHRNYVERSLSKQNPSHIFSLVISTNKLLIEITNENM